VVLRDFFLEEANDWEYGDVDGELAGGQLSARAGKYRFDITSISGVVWWSRALAATATTDFYARVDARRLSGPADSDYGLVFRHTGFSYYYFQVSDSGQYALYRYDDGWTLLVDWTASAAIRPDEVNQLAVLAEGPRFTLFVNDQMLTEVEDDRLPSGSVGVAIQIYDGDENAVFEFDNFEWRAPAAAVTHFTPTPQP